jgi:hypothetical protein
MNVSDKQRFMRGSANEFGRMFTKANSERLAGRGWNQGLATLDAN